ncbi:G/U mismatch-specific DNA glycosylase [Myxococcus stipitatus DSM 14675]|uniref:G/U mismatch-specific DNA glycosylase n=1 Tax=Myxococcus stipitatus (strain DSM 14675 / JCM 12634 / Mx s8) TaxID=1278073 RepID=L7U5E3_MYXSD|nr:G/U mismatch-specific DNA glycosylase [Myxococcus stipitatus]AGC44076.1 G/U mismatch-specific DNA glycosylase [Myxococcus stipitatus DSM 14675]
MTASRGPTREELDAATGRSMPDIIARDLRVLFCGINPSLYSVVVGHHFARPGNRFWPTLHLSGFTARQLRPSEQDELLGRGLGITNFVDRATATADLLDNDELKQGARALEAKVRRYKPRVLAVLGMGAYRTAFARPKAGLGPQPETLGPSRLWVLPNPSGLNAHYQLKDLARLFAQLRSAVDER